jgi:hypothetical protein
MIKKKSFIFIAFILAVILIYFVHNYYDNDDGQIVTIYPSNEPAKVKPQNIEDIVLQRAESTIYENLQSKGKISRKITIKDELEEPVNIVKNMPNQKLMDPIDEIIANILEPQQKSDETLDIFTFQADNSKADERSTASQGLNVIQISVNDNSKLDTEKPISPKASHYKIQLGAVKSESAGLIEWERIKKKNPKIFSNSTMTLKKVPYDNGKFFYVIFEGKYRNINQAKIICKRLSNTGQNCIVTKYND